MRAIYVLHRKETEVDWDKWISKINDRFVMLRETFGMPIFLKIEPPMEYGNFLEIPPNKYKATFYLKE